MMRRISLLLILAFHTWAQAGFNTSECGVTKHCISFPPNCHEDANQLCQYMISHSPNGTSVIIELFGSRGSNDVQYVAAGFSNDDQMGGEPVVACVNNPNGQLSLIYSINEGRSNLQNPGVDKSDGELLDSVVTDKVIYCKIRQSIKPTDDSLPDLTKDFQMLVAQGPRQETGQIGYHSDRKAMPSITNFAKPLALGAPSNETGIEANNVPIAQGSGPFSFTSATKRNIIKWHGFLMLVGWFAMIAIGVFSARYLRPATPNTKIGGLHLWFHLHRTINFLAILVIIVSAILIFVAKDLEWTGPKLGADSEYNYNPGAIHSLIGVIAILLALTQPIGALMRCAPSDSRRPIFNWVHRLLGLVAIIGALIASYIAINSFTSLWSNLESPRALIIIYTVAAILLIIALELFAFSRIRNRRKVTIVHGNGMELRNRAKASSEDGFETTYHVTNNERTTKDKLVEISGFVLFSVISIAFVILVALFLL